MTNEQINDKNLLDQAPAGQVGQAQELNSDGMPTVYRPDLLAFIHEGYEIRNPFFLPDGVTPCEPTYYGFRLDGTGGTGKAWHLYKDDGHTLIVCDNEDGEEPATAETWPEASIGLMDEDYIQIAGWILGEVPGKNGPAPTK